MGHEGSDLGKRKNPIKVALQVTTAMGDRGSMLQNHFVWRQGKLG